MPTRLGIGAVLEQLNASARQVKGKGGDHSKPGLLDYG